MKQTMLGVNPELQALIRLIVSVLGEHGAMVLETLVALDRSGYSFERAAETMGLKSGAIRVRMHRFKARLRETLGESYAIPVRRRAHVGLGADDRAYRIAAASGPEEMGGDEL